MDLRYDRAGEPGSLFDCPGAESSEVFHKPQFHSAGTCNAQPFRDSVLAIMREKACKLDFKVKQLARQGRFSDFKSAEFPKIRANRKTKRVKLPMFGAPRFQKTAQGWPFESFCFLVGMNCPTIRTFQILKTTD
jgi:hypothetical protein